MAKIAIIIEDKTMTTEELIETIKCELMSGPAHEEKLHATEFTIMIPEQER